MNIIQIMYFDICIYMKYIYIHCVMSTYVIIYGIKSFDAFNTYIFKFPTIKY